MKKKVKFCSYDEIITFIDDKAVNKETLYLTILLKPNLAYESVKEELEKSGKLKDELVIDLMLTPERKSSDDKIFKTIFSFIGSDGHRIYVKMSEKLCDCSDSWIGSEDVETYYYENIE